MEALESLDPSTLFRHWWNLCSYRFGLIHRLQPLATDPHFIPLPSLSSDNCHCYLALHKYKPIEFDPVSEGMKSRATFRAQSAPQWAPCETKTSCTTVYAQFTNSSFVLDDVDYDELKNLIKVHTTKHEGQAIAIPEQSDIASKEFEDLFFNELSNQHDCVDLFVKSKADEISRRLRE